MSLIISAARELTDVELQTTMPTEQRLKSHTLLPLWQIRAFISGTLLLQLRKKNKKQPVLMCIRGFLFKNLLNYRMKRKLEMSHIYGSGERKAPR